MKLRLNFLNKDRETELYCFLVKTLFKLKSYTYWCRNINYPKSQCIFALWHGQQCALYSLNDKNTTHVMISKSKDGEIIARAAEAMGLKVIRGSQSRGGSKATLEMLETLKQGDFAAITIDGPRGPRKIVKKGIIEISKISGVPIVPMVWHSPSKLFVKFKTWDEFIFPFWGPKMAALYGNPVYVPQDADDNKIEEIRKTIENELNNLYERLTTDFDNLYKKGIKMQHK